MELKVSFPAFSMLIVKVTSAHGGPEGGETDSVIFMSGLSTVTIQVLWLAMRLFDASMPVTVAIFASGPKVRPFLAPRG
jgi:hypothetical protein